MKFEGEVKVCSSHSHPCPPAAVAPSSLRAHAPLRCPSLTRPRRTASTRRRPATSACATFARTTSSRRSTRVRGGQPRAVGRHVAPASHALPAPRRHPQVCGVVRGELRDRPQVGRGGEPLHCVWNTMCCAAAGGPSAGLAHSVVGGVQQTVTGVAAHAPSDSGDTGSRHPQQTRSGPEPAAAGGPSKGTAHIARQRGGSGQGFAAESHHATSGPGVGHRFPAPATDKGREYP